MSLSQDIILLFNIVSLVKVLKRNTNRTGVWVDLLSSERLKLSKNKLRRRRVLEAKLGDVTRRELASVVERGDNVVKDVRGLVGSLNETAVEVEEVLVDSTVVIDSFNG